jgi:hypothetical protein
MDNGEEEDNARRIDDGTPSGIISILVISLGAQAVMSRATLKALQNLLDTYSEDDSEPSREELCRLIDHSMDSFYNCIRSLVEIGESSIQRLAPTGQAIDVCSLIVKSLVQAYLDPTESAVTGYRSTGYLGRLRSDLQTKSLISPTRYSEGISQATVCFQRRAASSTLNGHDSTEIQTIKAYKSSLAGFFRQTPSNDVKDVVRDLFIRDLISIQHSGCGYGDVLVWLGFEVHPFDPIIFQDINNHPTSDDDNQAWDYDEVNALTFGQSWIGSKFLYSYTFFSGK